MGIIKGKLFAERQGWQEQHCSRNAAPVNNNSEPDSAAQRRRNAAEADVCPER